MEGESNGMEGGQSQCRAGCGFFGSSATDGLCSLCYKEVVKKKQQPPTGSLKIPSPQRITPPCEARTSPSPQIQTEPPSKTAAQSLVDLEDLKGEILAMVPNQGSTSDDSQLVRNNGPEINSEKGGDTRQPYQFKEDGDFLISKFETNATALEPEKAAIATGETDILAAPATNSKEAEPSTGCPTGSDTKKKSNRCQMCRKKVGLTGFECRCGGLYCSLHRYSDKHNCTFDYRQMGAEEIRKNNPVVVGEKINKI